ncbi:hypothetical protein [Chryseobacterium sp. 18068]|uniref:hypothetical protein n=1 Tax=Chryseobacterium sp. 18068 TaxID=2681414 RepID=UPI00135A2D98|nr:hypothetical protein [Chryseobacterium sp. 18068]
MSAKLVKEIRRSITIYYFLKGNKKVIIGQLPNTPKYSSDRNKFSEILVQLRNNKFMYYRLNWNYPIFTTDQLIFILRTTKKTKNQIFLHASDNFWDCYGKIDSEYNFFFRIYDHNIANKINEILKQES